jgi:hypothetical protein
MFVNSYIGTAAHESGDADDYDEQYLAQPQQNSSSV